MKSTKHKKISFLTFCLTAMLSIPSLSLRAQHMHMQMDSQAKKNVFSVMMDSMMSRMASAPVGISKSDYFINQMLPHHLGAVEMTRYEIAHGRNTEMIQLAKSILAEQQSEIMQMKILMRSSHEAEKLDDLFREQNDQAMDKMMKELPAEPKEFNVDRSFAAVMLPHHKAAVDMARILLSSEVDQGTSAFAKMLISNEQVEIDQMKNYLKNDEK